MDLQDQLKNLFPAFSLKEKPVEKKPEVWLQEEPIL